MWNIPHPAKVSASIHTNLRGGSADENTWPLGCIQAPLKRTLRLWNNELNGVDEKSNHQRRSMSTRPNGLVLFFNWPVITLLLVQAIRLRRRKMTDQETVLCAICGEPIEQNSYRYASEKGQAVHQFCCEDVIIANTPNPDGPHAG
jgi:hypothetical protein